MQIKDTPGRSKDENEELATIAITVIHNTWSIDFDRNFNSFNPWQLQTGGRPLPHHDFKCLKSISRTVNLRELSIASRSFSLGL